METIWKQWLKMKKWLKIPLLQVPEMFLKNGRGEPI
jgi:hypothetical protein